jgi:hypothetical protein
VNTIEVVEFVEWLPHGSTTPFLAYDREGALWVIKASKALHRNKPLVSELVGGSIANWLQLPWPTTEPARLEGSAYDAFRTRFPDSRSNLAVAIRHVAGLTPVRYPSVDSSADFLVPLDKDPWLKAIRDTLTPYLALEDNMKAIYGRAILDNWLLAQDGKTDQLQLDGNRFVLLDASASLGGVSWSIAESRVQSAAPVRYSGRGCATYSWALIARAEPYMTWLSKVESYPQSHLEGMLALAAEWIETSRLDLVRTIVLPATTFVERFRATLDAEFSPWRR